MKPGPNRSQTVLDAESPETSACQHHWVIARPAGPTSKGVCRHCSEEREFQNYVEGSPWRYERSLDQQAGGARVPAGVRVPRAGENSGEDEDA